MTWWVTQKEQWWCNDAFAYVVPTISYQNQTLDPGSTVLIFPFNLLCPILQSWLVSRQCFSSQGSLMMVLLAGQSLLWSWFKNIESQRVTLFEKNGLPSCTPTYLLSRNSHKVWDYTHLNIRIDANLLLIFSFWSFSFFKFDIVAEPKSNHQHVYHKVIFFTYHFKWQSQGSGAGGSAGIFNDCKARNMHWLLWSIWEMDLNPSASEKRLNEC